MAPGILTNDYEHTNSATNGHTNGSTYNVRNGNADEATAIPNDPSNGRTRSREPIAIIGISAKFGGSATSPSRLWDMVYEGRNAWSPIPKDRFDVNSFYHADKDRPGRVSLYLSQSWQPMH